LSCVVGVIASTMPKGAPEKRACGSGPPVTLLYPATEVPFRLDGEGGLGPAIRLCVSRRQLVHPRLNGGGKVGYIQRGQSTVGVPAC
jgi:hypothetical protein